MKEYRRGSHSVFQLHIHYGVVYKVSKEGARARCWKAATRALSVNMLGHGRRDCSEFQAFKFLRDGRSENEKGI